MKIKIYYILVLVFLILNTNVSNSKNGDTTKVRTIEFQASRVGWFDFPSNPNEYERVYLNYKLRCPPGKPCGEWDYLAHIFIRLYYAPNFRIDSNVVNEFIYSEKQTYNYTYKLENKVLKLDSTATKSNLLEFYEDSEKLTVRTNSKTVYKATFRYIYKNDKLDSILVGNDNTLKLIKTKVDFNDNVTFYESVELYRYITPYGNGLNLGSGFTWVQDVTDFASLLSGKVFLDAPNSQEDLELTFDYIKGEPVRNIKRFIPICQKWVTYNSDFENIVSPVEISLDESEKQIKYKHIQTGHGFGGNSDNCAEFCRRKGFVKVNGEVKYNLDVWRECGDNPVFPQGGTWLTDRTNWCPGAEVSPYDFELTPYITENKFTIDWDMEFYNTPYNNGSNQDPRWLINSYIVTYEDIKFQNNVEIVDIPRPSTKQIYQRLNPTCNFATVIIRNSGKDNLKSLDIKYGDKFKNQNTFKWTGNLKFNDTAWVVLPPYETGNETNNTFEVELVNPNGKLEEYIDNNKATSIYKATAEYYNNITLELVTNNYDILNASSPYSYRIVNSNGDIVFELKETQNRQKYSNELILPDDCYELILENQFGYGLYFWVLARDNSGNNNGFYPGSFKLLNNNLVNSLTFNNDFGNKIIHQFRTGPQPTASANLDTLNFGYIKVGEELEKSVVVKPENIKGIEISNVDIQLASFKGFEITKTIPKIMNNKLILKEGDSLEIFIKFKPKSNGNKSSSLIVNTNDKSKSSLNINIQAFGGEPTGIIENELNNELDINELLMNVIVNDNLLSIKLNNEINLNNSKINIYDLLGNNLISQKFNSYSDIINSQIDIKELNNGLYFIVLENNNNFVNSKFIINK